MIGAGAVINAVAVAVVGIIGVINIIVVNDNIIGIVVL